MPINGIIAKADQAMILPLLPPNHFLVIAILQPLAGNDSLEAIATPDIG